jgi:hypothetical protein
MLARVNGVPNDQLGLAQQIAAQLLPEAGDSWAVEAEQDLGPGVELRRLNPDPLHAVEGSPPGHHEPSRSRALHQSRLVRAW